jgi:hypothetical protein
LPAASPWPATWLLPNINLQFPAVLPRGHRRF